MEHLYLQAVFGRVENDLRVLWFSGVHPVTTIHNQSDTSDPIGTFREQEECGVLNVFNGSNALVKDKMVSKHRVFLD